MGNKQFERNLEKAIEKMVDYTGIEYDRLKELLDTEWLTVNKSRVDKRWWLWYINERGDSVAIRICDQKVMTDDKEIDEHFC